jgi:hypothetical protein
LHWLLEYNSLSVIAFFIISIFSIRINCTKNFNWCIAFLIIFQQKS